MRVLFTSMSCLIDPSSGAAISVRTILKSLADRGHEVMSLSGACFDSAQKSSSVETLRWSKFHKEATTNLWRFQEGNVKHLAYPFSTTHPGQADIAMINKLTQVAAQIISEFTPDVIISYGATPYEKNVRRVAHERGIATVFYLANPGYTDASSFADTDLIVTDSVATQELYRDRLNLDSIVIGKFILQHDVKRPSKSARHVTFVNPSYHKGVTLFFRIAEMMNVTLPSLKFLVVESRSNLISIEEQTGIPFSQMRNIRRIGLQVDMTEIFSRTHILMMPSLWHESGGRTAIEALSHGVPVITSNHGGLPEHLGDGAHRIDVPQVLRDNPRLIPAPSVAVPWVSALAQLWTDSEHWDRRSAASAQQWKAHEPSARIRMIEAKLQELTNANH